MTTTMKKFSTVLLMFLMIFALSVPASAASSKPATKTSVSTKTTKKTSKKKVALKKAATKTYTKKLPATVKKSTTSTKSESETNTTTVRKDTTVKTTVSEKYTKKSKTKVVTTVTTTTVKTTTIVTPKEKAKAETQSISTKDLKQYAPLADARFVNAWKRLGFTLNINSNFTYTGAYDINTRSVSVKENNDFIYYELGHVLGWLTGNDSNNTALVLAYTKEKALFQGNDSLYTKNCTNYFAQSFREYCLNKAALKASRPMTYKVIENALNHLTNQNIDKVNVLLTAFGK